MLVKRSIHHETVRVIGADGRTPELSIVIPAFNEQATVADVVTRHRDVAATVASSFELVVCDDGSTDQTWRRLMAATHDLPELRLIRNPGNQGIPATMKTLYAEARGTWIYFAPADGQVPARALAVMWKHREGAALVVGRRTPRRDPRSRVLMAQLYSTVLRGMFRLPVHDIDSVKLYLARELRRTSITAASNFFEAEILISLHRRGLTIREVIIPHEPRSAGSAKGVTPRAAMLAVYEVVAFAIRDRMRSSSRH